MTRSMMAGLGAALLATAVGTGTAAAQDRPFRSMSVDDGSQIRCEIPRVPVEFATTGGQNDAFKYWFEKLELQHRLEAGKCDCQGHEIDWEQVREVAEPWLIDYLSNPVIVRREITMEIEMLLIRLREECAG